MEHLIASVERKGIPFREFLAAKNEEGVLPRFHVMLNDEHLFIHSDDQFEELKGRDEEEQRKKHEETLSSIPEEEQTEEMKTLSPAPSLLWSSMKREAQGP